MGAQVGIFLPQGRQEKGRFLSPPSGCPGGAGVTSEEFSAEILSFLPEALPPSWPSLAALWAPAGGACTGVWIGL